MKLRPTTETVAIRWFVYAGGEKFPMESSMRSYVGYDFECSCGFKSSTGGAIKACIKREIEDHKFYTHDYEYVSSERRKPLLTVDDFGNLVPISENNQSKERDKVKTKTSVRKDFGYLRALLKEANYLMTDQEFNKSAAEELANEIIAAATVFSEWVEEQK